MVVEREQILLNAQVIFENKSESGKLLDVEDDREYFVDIKEDIPLFKQTSYDSRSELNEKIMLYKGDITSLEVDAIVNAARCSLLGGGGIDGKIHSVAGPELKDYCSHLGPIDYGEVRISPSFGNIKSKWIIHAVGPRNELVNETERRDMLKQVYYRCLDTISSSNDINGMYKLFENQPDIKLQMNPIKSIALCCISVGAFRCPLRDSTHIALSCIRNWMEKHHNLVNRIFIVVYTQWELDTYCELLPAYFP